MDYKKIYFSLMEKRKKFPSKNEYIERHHIIPRSLGGSDNKSNIVKLSAREHFMAHWLLSKMYERGTREYKKMTYAFFMMFHIGRNQKREIYNKKLSHLYEKLKEELSDSKERLYGENNGVYGIFWITNPETNENKKINKNDCIPDGWKKGRYIERRLKKTKKEIKQEKSIKRIAEKEKLAKEYHEFYRKFGFEKFKESFNYPYSKQNLVIFLARNCKDFVPQSRIKRGTKSSIITEQSQQ